MSSLLEQAIIDAKLLRETAQKNAEAALLDKYKDKVRESINMLLEQDESDVTDPSLGIDPVADPAASSDPLAMPALPTDSSLDAAPLSPEAKKVVDAIPASYLGENNAEEVEINLDSILEKIDSLESDLNLKTPDFSNPAHDPVAASNPTMAPAYDGLAESEEQEDNIISEEEQLEEELIVDLENVSPGGINANEIELKRQYNVSKALEAQNVELNEELNSKVKELDEMELKLQTALTRLQETRTKLKKSAEINVKLKEGLEFLTKKINDVNLLNGRLLYTNKILGNSSLNERQKKQIAESISKATSVEEAETIYETLQRSADAIIEKKSAPQSLTEALNKAPSAFLPRNNNTAFNSVRERMQILSGIIKK